jgi:hypothetical protein
VLLGEREIRIEVIPLPLTGGGQSFLILFDDGSHRRWLEVCRARHRAD